MHTTSCGLPRARPELPFNLDRLTAELHDSSLIKREYEVTNGYFVRYYYFVVASNKRYADNNDNSNDNNFLFSKKKGGGGGEKTFLKIEKTDRFDGRSLKETWKDVENGERDARIKTSGRNFLFRDVAASSCGATSTRTFITFHPAISSKRLNDSAPRLKSLAL